MRIAYLRTDYYHTTREGGSFSHMRGFSQGVLKSGHSIFIVTSGEMEGICTKEIPLYTIKYPTFFNLMHETPEIAYNYKFIREAFTILKKEKPDMIYHRHSGFNFSSVVLSRLLNIPLILEVNNIEVWLRENWDVLHLKNLCTFTEKVVFKSADAIAVVSDILRNDLVRFGVSANKILVNPNGVDPDFFSPNVDGTEIRTKYSLNDKIVVGFVGSFGVWHGVDLLTKAIKPVVQKNRHIHFLIVGSGDLKNTVEEEIETMGMREYVTFAGTVPHNEVPKYLAACDILVSPHVPMKDGSEFFGSPTKLFEYMAMAKGIVASDLGQIGKVLQNNESAILVEPGNKEELMKGILTLAENKKLREKLGERAREDAINNHTWQKNAERVVKSYEQLIKESKLK